VLRREFHTRPANTPTTATQEMIGRGAEGGDVRLSMAGPMRAKVVAQGLRDARTDEESNSHR